MVYFLTVEFVKYFNIFQIKVSREKNDIWKNSIKLMTFMIYIHLLHFCTMKYLAINEKASVMCNTVFHGNFHKRKKQ